MTVIDPMSRQQKADVKIPFSLRLKAWWEGYDTDDIKERLKKLTVSNMPKREVTVRPPEVMDAETLDPWDDNTVDIAQYIWGKGFCGPGGPDYIISLSKLLAISSKKGEPKLSQRHSNRMQLEVYRGGLKVR